MSRQVLIINVTRMGDLVQTIPLLGRLKQEWPDVAIDLIVDTTFAPMAALLPGIRHVLAYDFQALTDRCRAKTKDVVALYQEIAEWTRPLREARYDRIVNLTFNRRSGLLAAHIGASDIRGVTVAADGTSILRDPWLTYFTDMHRYRRFNRFNLVDVYALGGSGPGPYAPLTLSSASEASEWAGRFVYSNGAGGFPVAVQIGASEPIKAWRPDLFGRTMAFISRQTAVTFVVIGSKSEAGAVEEAIQAYRAAGGTSTIHNAVGRTDLPKLAALLGRCRLLLTNDTGPMHVAVAVGTRVVDLSVGHVDFNETGPYGQGHWVVQPDLGCAPCGFDQMCPHHACKDRLIPEQIAALCLHAADVGPFPEAMAGVRVYEAGIDGDGLACYRLRAGHVDRTADWYGQFWRKYWYEVFTEQVSTVDTAWPPPDFEEALSLFGKMEPIMLQLVRQTAYINLLARQHPLPVERLKLSQDHVNAMRIPLLGMAIPSPAFGPTTVALIRELHNSDAMELSAMTGQQAAAYRTWSHRVRTVMDRLHRLFRDNRSARVGAGSSRIRLLMS